MIRMNGIPALAVLTGVFVACINPFGNDDPGWLHASIMEANESQFAGVGWFSEQDATRATDPIRLPRRFTIIAMESGDSLDQQIHIHRSGGGKLEEGTYVLQPLEDVDGMPDGLAAYYSRYLEIEGRSERFTAELGELVVTKSSGSRVEGTFRFSGVMYCRTFNVPDTEGTFCHAPNTIDSATARMEVTGSFSVVPREKGGYVFH